MSCFKRIGLAFALFASCSVSLGGAVSDQEFEELVERFAISGASKLLFEIAASEHPRAIEVLLLAKEHRRPVDLIDQLGIEVDSEPSLTITSTQEQLDLGLAIAGHRPSWEAFVRPVLGTDPCSSEFALRRQDFFRTIHRLKYDRVVRFLAWLLYHDDERPEAYAVGGGCFSTSAFAAVALDRMFGVSAPLTGSSVEMRRRELVGQMKQWWRENASSYGVEDPDSLFVLNPVSSSGDAFLTEAPDTGQSALPFVRLSLEAP